MNLAKSASGPFAAEMACPPQVRFYPDNGFDDETQTRPASMALTASVLAERRACTFVCKRYLAT